MSKLTSPQFRILHRLLLSPGAAISTEQRGGNGYSEIPTFHSRWLKLPCPTCGHAEKGDAVPFRTVFALEEAGFLKSCAAYCGYLFTARHITEKGRAAHTAYLQTERGVRIAASIVLTPPVPQRAKE